MAYTDNFRIVMRGFHRGDVVQFIRRLESEHEKERATLVAENERLVSSLESLQKESEALRQENFALKERRNEPTPAAAPAEAPTADLNAEIPPAAPTVSAEPNVNELELAAYRRAEMTERLARERAAAADEQMRALFAQSREKMTLATGDLSTILATVESDFEQLRQVVRAAQTVLDESDIGVTAVEHIFGEP